VSSADTIAYNPLYFSVKDADGFESQAVLGAESDQPLASGELVKGDKARGSVAFEVKSAAKGLILSYKPIIIGNNTLLRVQLT